MGFDPFKVENWDKLRYRQLRVAGISTHLNNGSLRQAMRDAFPELQFKSGGNRHWDHPENVRAFMESFAEDKGFNPLDGESWLTVKLEDMLAYKGGHALRSKYGGLRKAVEATYPQLTIHWR